MRGSPHDALHHRIDNDRQLLQIVAIHRIFEFLSDSKSGFLGRTNCRRQAIKCRNLSIQAVIRREAYPLPASHGKFIMPTMESDLMIGISGMRGTIGGSLTPAVVVAHVRRVCGIPQNPATRRHGQALKVVFGRDSRPSGTWVRDAAIAALVASGLEVVDLDIVTTPGVAMMVKHLDADAGMIATASHNPIEWNGLKFLNRDAVAPPAADADDHRRFYHDGSSRLRAASNNLIPPRRRYARHTPCTSNAFWIMSMSLGISSKRYKVVLDSVNGAGCVATATLLSKLGCQLIHLNAIPDGRFAHEPEPTEKNLTGLADEVRRQKAAVGFAQDPDADRLAIVDENGRYIGEEYSLALCAKWISRPSRASR